jgi:hypothetical protein
MSETRRHVASSHVEVKSHIHFVTAPDEPVKSLKVRSYHNINQAIKQNENKKI